MPDGRTHSLVAFIVAIIFFVALMVIGLDEYAFFTFGIVLGGNLPDILEPATDYKHRKYFHSIRFMRALLIPLALSFVIGLYAKTVLWLFFTIIGYYIHLCLDSTTPMGLPKC